MTRLSGWIFYRCSGNATSHDRERAARAISLESSFVFSYPENRCFIVRPSPRVGIDGQLDLLLGLSHDNRRRRFDDIRRIDARGSRSDVQTERSGRGKCAVVRLSHVNGHLSRARHCSGSLQLAQSITRTARGTEVRICVIGHRELAVVPRRTSATIAADLAILALHHRAVFGAHIGIVVSALLVRVVADARERRAFVVAA